MASPSRTFWTICDVVDPAQSRVSTVQKHSP